MELRLFEALLCLSSLIITSSSQRYDPTWESLDSRPLPDWYDEAKFGIFIHWGVFSVPGVISEWFWFDWEAKDVPEAVEYMRANYPPDWTYADFAPKFTAEFYDPYQWAELFNASGAKYVVLTSKHHEGYCMWPSKYSFNWNSGQVGPKRDLVGDLAQAVRKTTPHIHFGLYHSLFEWFNPMWIDDVDHLFLQNTFAHGKTMPELYELVNSYQPEIIWSDGYGAPYLYWNSTAFLAWLYNDSPVKDRVVVNDRWGVETPCKHGGFLTCQDSFNPGHLEPFKWENALSIDQEAWGYRKRSEVSDYRTIENLLYELASTVSCGGNMLLNIGPTADGRIMPILEERLRQIGDWLSVNGDAIYSTVPWKVAQNDTITKDVWYTSKKNAQAATGYDVYAIVLFWPDDNVLTLGAPVAASQTTITMLGYSDPLQYSFSQGQLKVTFPYLTPTQMPCKWAWVLKLHNLQN